MTDMKKTKKIAGTRIIKNSKSFKMAVFIAAVMFISMGNRLVAHAQLVFDAVSGGYVDASSTDMVACIECGGSGGCGHCDGTGTLVTSFDSWRCTFCRGTGDCQTCGGGGGLTEVEYVVERNKDNASIGYVKTGSADALYVCTSCYGTGLCRRCSGDGINDTTGRTCSSCKSSAGECKKCSGYGCMTRDEHNQKINDTIRKNSGNSESEAGTTCSTCGGSGHGKVCHTCGGDGKYKGYGKAIGAFNGYRCIHCDGSGYEQCSTCRGKGKV